MFSFLASDNIAMTIGLPVVVVIVVVVWRAVVVVYQDTVAVVERFGRAHRALESGLHVLWPLVERVAHTVPAKDVLMVEYCGTFVTRLADGHTIRATASVRYRVVDAVKGAYVLTRKDAVVADALQRLVEFCNKRSIAELARHVDLQDLLDNAMLLSNGIEGVWLIGISEIDGKAIEHWPPLIEPVPVPPQQQARRMRRHSGART